MDDGFGEGMLPQDIAMLLVFLTLVCFSIGISFVEGVLSGEGEPRPSDMVVDIEVIRECCVTIATHILVWCARRRPQVSSTTPGRATCILNF